jgi:hypothetical protein
MSRKDMIASLQMGCLKTAKDKERRMVMARDPNLQTVSNSSLAIKDKTTRTVAKKRCRSVGFIAGDLWEHIATIQQ